MIQSEFELIYRSYFQNVYKYLLKLSKDEKLAEELTSETFFKALKAIDHFQGKSSISTWLITIARNSYFNYLKSNRDFTDIDEVTEISDDKVDIEAQFIENETSTKIYSIICILDEPYKEIFKLRVFEELSFKQIGEMYGKTENWACVTYHRAKSKIKARLEDSI